MTEVGLLAETIIVLAFAFGLVVVGYEEHARLQGWPVGEYFTGVAFVKIFGFMVAAGSVVASLVVTPWWFVFVTLLGGFLIGFVMSRVFKSWVQPVALAGCAACFVAAPIYVW